MTSRYHSLRHHYDFTYASSEAQEQVLIKALSHRNNWMVRRYYHTLDLESQR